MDLGFVFFPVNGALVILIPNNRIKKLDIGFWKNPSWLFIYSITLASFLRGLWPHMSCLMSHRWFNSQQLAGLNLRKNNIMNAQVCLLAWFYNQLFYIWRFSKNDDTLWVIETIFFHKTYFLILLCSCFWLFVQELNYFCVNIYHLP